MNPRFTWRVARESLPFFIGLLAVSAAAWALGSLPVALGALFLALLVLAFFRDPDRVTDVEPGVVVSPADGRVVRVTPEADGRGPSISIFLSLFDVHINRVPIGGRVASVERSVGAFRAAYRDEASDENARVLMRIETTWGPVECVQIVGVLARRIVCRLEPGDEVETGQRYGLMQFGSRMDVHLPPGAVVLVEPGRRTRAGVTPIARLGA